MTVIELHDILKEGRMKKWNLGMGRNAIDYARQVSEIMRQTRDELNKAGWYCIAKVYGQYNGRNQFIDKNGRIVEEDITAEYPQYGRAYRTIRTPVDGYDPYLDTAIESAICPM